MPKLALVPKLSDASDQAVIDALRRSPVVAHAVEERAAALLEERGALVTELAKLERDAEKTLPKLQAARETAAAKIRTAQIAMTSAAGLIFGEQSAAREIARAEWAEAHQKCLAASLAYTAAHDELEHKLRSTASLLIVAFKTEMLNEIDKLGKSPVTEDAEVSTNIVTGRKKVRVHRSSAFAKTIRLHAILVAIDAADRLALVADQATVPGELDRMRAALPSADAFYPPPRHGSATMDLLSDLKAGVAIEEAVKRHGLA